MNLRELTAKVYRSRTARMLSGSVAASIFILQLLVYAPTVYSEYRQAVKDRLDVEKALLGSSMRTTNIASLDIPENLLTDTLVGLVVTRDATGVVFNAGETLGFDINAPLPESSNNIKPVQLTLGVENGEFDAIAFVYLGKEFKTGMVHILALVLVAAFVSAAAGLVAVWSTARFYIRPLDNLIAALRVSRENGGDLVPTLVDIGAGEDLSQITDEFNGLIEAQRKSARQVKVKQQYLEFAAHHDPLTHLPNRLMFEDALKRTVRDALSEKSQFAVFLVDMDNFKFFNDQYGHLIGDKMVAVVGNRLRTMMRDIDVVARLDGDEFVVIQKQVKDTKSTEEVAKRIMSVATEPFEYRGFTL